MRNARVFVTFVALALAKCATLPQPVLAGKASIRLYVNGALASRQGTVLGSSAPGRPFAIQPVVIYDDPEGVEGCPEYRVEYIVRGQVQAASAAKGECSDPKRDSYTPRGADVGAGVWVVKATVTTARRTYIQSMEVQVW